MFSLIKKVIYKILLLTPNGQKFLINKLVRKGAKIGKNIKIYGVSSVNIDETRPYLLSIGDNVHITHGVTILTHDYSKIVLLNYYGELLGEGKRTEIGNNCFIGMNSTILMGSTIGNNVIIGAGSIVRGKIPDNVVVAGCPAKVLCTLDEFYKKRKVKTIEEAILCAKIFKERYGEYPKENDMKYFRSLFLPQQSKKFEKNPQEPIWNNFNDFMSNVKNDISFS